LWDAESAEVKCEKRMPKGCRLVTAIGISSDEKYVCASDAAEKITAYVFNISGAQTPVADVVINYKVTHLAWDPN
jgi:hypothetical protein